MYRENSRQVLLRKIRPSNNEISMVFFSQYPSLQNEGTPLLKMKGPPPVKMKGGSLQNEGDSSKYSINSNYSKEYSTETDLNSDISSPKQQKSKNSGDGRKTHNDTGFMKVDASDLELKMAKILRVSFDKQVRVAAEEAGVSRPEFVDSFSKWYAHSKDNPDFKPKSQGWKNGIKKLIEKHVEIKSAKEIKVTGQKGKFDYEAMLEAYKRIAGVKEHVTVQEGDLERIKKLMVGKVGYLEIQYLFMAMRGRRLYSSLQDLIRHDERLGKEFGEYRTKTFELIEMGKDSYNHPGRLPENKPEFVLI